MDIFLKEHKKFLLLLSKHQVNYLLIGGYAVISHGYERTTNDMDVWLEPTNENRDKFVNALREQGVVDNILKAVAKMDFTKPQVLTIGKKPNQIEFLTVVTGLNFDEANKQKVLVDLEDQQIGLLGYEDLIANKILTDRPQDKADVHMLQEIQQEKDKNK
jgi:hypothetical protein